MDLDGFYFLLFLSIFLIEIMVYQIYLYFLNSLLKNHYLFFENIIFFDVKKNYHVSENPNLQTILRFWSQTTFEHKWHEIKSIRGLWLILRNMVHLFLWIWIYCMNFRFKIFKLFDKPTMYYHEQKLIKYDNSWFFRQVI